MTRNEKGFTLVELLIGITIMVIILGGTAVILDNSTKAHIFNINKSNNIYDANNAVNRISEELQYAYAKSITIEASGKAQADETHTGSGYYTLPVEETNEIYLARGVEGGTNLESRHIYVKDNKIIMDCAAYPQNAYPWPQKNITKTVELTTGKVKSLSFRIEGVPADIDINDPRARRKKFTITVTVLGNSTKSAEEVVYTTEVITNNTVLN